MFGRFPSLRVTPADTPEERLRVGHVRELVQEGTIGALAEHNYSQSRAHQYSSLDAGIRTLGVAGTQAFSLLIKP